MTRDQVFGVIREQILTLLPDVEPEHVHPTATCGSWEPTRSTGSTSWRGHGHAGIEVPAHHLAGVGDIGAAVDMLHRLSADACAPAVAAVPAGGGVR